MKHKKTIKAVLLLAASLTVMAGAVVAPSLPEIGKHFGPTGDQDVLVKLVLTTPGLVIALLAPLAGFLTDWLGRKRLLVWSLLVYGLGGTTGYFSGSLIFLLATRVVLGLGVAGVMNTAVALAGDYFEGKERAAFVGLQSGFMALGGVLYLNLGGFLADISWRYNFLVYGTAFVLLPLAAWFIFEPPKTVPPTAPDGKPSQVLRLSSLIPPYLMGFLGMLFFYMIPIQIPFLLQDGLGVSNQLVGLAISMSTVTSALAAVSYNRLKQLLGFWQVFALSLALMGIGFFFVYFSGSYWQMLAALAFSGIGTGLIMPNCNFWLLEKSPGALRGRVLGFFSSCIFIGQFLSPVLSSVLEKPKGLAAGFALAGMALMGIAFFTAVYGWGRDKRASELAGSPVV